MVNARRAGADVRSRRWLGDRAIGLLHHDAVTIFAEFFGAQAGLRRAGNHRAILDREHRAVAAGRAIMASPVIIALPTGTSLAAVLVPEEPQATRRAPANVVAVPSRNARRLHVWLWEVIPLV